MNFAKAITSLTQPALVPAQHIKDTALNYNTRSLRGDIIAGLTVAVISIPQSMAYAIIAGVDPKYGIYTLIFQSIIAAPFNSMPLLSVGPTILHAMLSASVATRLVAPGNPHVYLGLIVTITLVKGIFQLILGAVNMGSLARYVSKSVVVGLTAGVGILIIIDQIHSLLGFSVQAQSANWPGIAGSMQELLPNLSQMSWISLILGLATVPIVLLSKKISKFIPGSLIAIILTSIIVYLFGFTSKDFSLVGALPRSLPSPSLPDMSWHNITSISTVALALALFGLIDTWSIGKTLAAKRGGKVNGNQDLISQGITHVVGSFFSCFPGSGSFSRSALNEYAGAQTFVSNIYCGLFVLIIFLILAPTAAYIPMACIAGILFVIGYNLIDWRYFLRALPSNKSDAAVCAATCIAMLVMPLVYAVFVGIFLNIAVYLRKASHLHMEEMVRTPEGPFLERPVNMRNQKPGTNEKKVIFLQIEGDLFFAQADELEARLNELVNSEVLVVILRLKRTHSIDATVLTVLEQFIVAMNSANKHVLLCGVRPEMADHLESFGLTKILGKKNLFSVRYGVFQSAKQALARAKEIVGSSVDVEGLQDDGDDKIEGWSYQI